MPSVIDLKSAKAAKSVDSPDAQASRQSETLIGKLNTQVQQFPFGRSWHVLFDCPRGLGSFSIEEKAARKTCEFFNKSGQFTAEIKRAGSGELFILLKER